MFGAKDGYVSARLVRNQINAASVKTGKPLAPWSRRRWDFLDSLAYDPAIHLDMDLQLGDMQLCNNLTILYSRTALRTGRSRERRRHMIRLWLTFHERRPWAMDSPPQNGYGRTGLPRLRSSPQSQREPRRACLSGRYSTRGAVAVFGASEDREKFGGRIIIS